MTMIDLSMHILDIVENSTRAGASLVSIEIAEDTVKNLMSITIADNGKGMTQEETAKALDPFYTTKTVRSHVGLGLPLLRNTAEQCGGSMKIESSPGKGTRVRTEMQLDHIDRPPLGDLVETMRILIAGNPDADFDLAYTVDGEEDRFSTREERRAEARAAEIMPGTTQ